MSETKQRTLPPAVPKRKPQGCRPKTGEGPSLLRGNLNGIAYNPQEPIDSPSSDQTTFKPSSYGPLNPTRRILHSRQGSGASSIHSIDEALPTVFASNRESTSELDAIQRNEYGPPGTLIPEKSLPLDTNSQTNRLSAYFALGESERAYTDVDFQRISNLLKDAGRLLWSKVPRVYTVLRIIGQLQIIDAFIDQGITDIWFPFSTSSLPIALGSALHPQFLNVQKTVLTKGMDLEKGEGRKHASFGRDDALPFKVNTELGGGRFSQVHKITSTISKREFARKQFRRGAGLRNAAEIKSFKVELQVLKKIHHHHCVELIGSYTDPKWFALIMSPVADCDLKVFYGLSKGDDKRMNILRSFYGCLALALDYLHTSKIRHRDIKPQNILVKGETVYLADFGISLDWEGLSRSTTTEDSAKTLLYCAPEVAQFKPRNTASDVWSLGCVFLEMATVLAGLEVEDMQTFFRTTNGDHRFYTNVEIIPSWSSFIAPKFPTGDDTPLEWITDMLQLDPAERLSTTYLVHSIATSSKHSPSTRFCGSCCEVDISSDGSESDEDLWADKDENVKPREDTELESLSELVKDHRLSSPSARSPPSLPYHQIEDMSQRRENSSVDIDRNSVERSDIAFLGGIERRLLQARSHRNQPQSSQRSNGENIEYRVAVEAAQAAHSRGDVDRKERYASRGGSWDDDLAEALRPSRQEEELQHRELDELNSSSLFTDIPTDRTTGQQTTSYKMNNPFTASYPRPASNNLATLSSFNSPITAADRAKFDALFESLDERRTGILTDEEVDSFFQEAKLPEETLARIWDLADIRFSGSLNKDEFAIALYLIRGTLAGGDVPSKLPPNLLPSTEQDIVKRDDNRHSTLTPLDLHQHATYIEHDVTEVNLNLTPEEKRLYGALFREADSENVGFAIQEVAVKSFYNAKIEPLILQQIWQIADKENRGFLTPRGFAIVLRLIGQYQAGRYPTLELALRPGPFPIFDSETAPKTSPPGPPSSVLQSQSSGSGLIRIPSLIPGKADQYSALFTKSGARDGNLSGLQAKQIFRRAGLPNYVLGEILRLVDIEQRGYLQVTEFVMAVHLLASFNSGSLRALPSVLPAELCEAAARTTPTGESASDYDELWRKALQ